MIFIFSATIIAGVIFMTLKVPSYAQIKAFYGLSALVPLCFFVATAWEISARRGKGQVHGVTRLVLRINREAGKNGVHSPDDAKSPASVHAKAAIGELDQRLNMVALQLACGSHFLKFFSHTVSYRSLPYTGMLY